MVPKLKYLLPLALLLLPCVAHAQYQGIPRNMGANVTLSGGTDTVTLASGNQKVTLGANEVITLAAGTFPITSSATNINPITLEVCQDGTGNRTLNFVAGAGVTNICYSGGGTCAASPAQPVIGYTLTASNGDVWKVDFNGTNVYLSQVMTNVPCQ